MRILFLDLVSHSGLLACVTPEGVAASVPVDGKVGDELLPELLHKTVTAAGWPMSDLTHIACVTGPGGFTSQRVAVAFANALAWGLKIPAAGVHLRELWTARSSADAAWAHSTKKDLLFFALPGEEIRTLPPADAATSVPKGTVLTGELLSDHEDVFRDAGVTLAEAVPVADVLPGLLRGFPYVSKPLEPWYGRGW